MQKLARGWVIKGKQTNKLQRLEGTFSGCPCCDVEPRLLTGAMLFKTKRDARPFLRPGQFIVKAVIYYER